MTLDLGLNRRVTTTLSAHQDVNSAADELLATALQSSGAARGAVYLLSLVNGRFEPLALPSGKGDGATWPDVSADDFPPRFANSDLIGSVPAERFTGANRSGVALLSFRQSTCLGALVLEGIDWDSASPATQIALESTAALLVPLFERRFTTELLSSLQTPLDFTQSRDDFLEEMGDLIGLSAGMEFSAIRELDDGALRCIGFWSHGEERKSKSLDIDDPSTLPPFAQAARGKAVAVSDVADVPEMRPFLDTAGLSNVRSFVAIPIEVGPDIFGVMSVAARCAFDYTPVELAGFESIANGLGVALTNYRAFHEAAGRIQEMTKTGFAITALEVATSARHEALNHLEDAQGKLLDVSSGLKPQPLKTLNAASMKIASAGKALGKIQVVADPPAKNLRRVDLKEIFEEAKEQALGRLQKENIKCNYSGPPVELDAYPEYLRSAFENLIFNSIDALKEGHRRGRAIEFSVTPPSAKDTHIRATFRDNGPGVQVQRLRLPEDAEGPRRGDLIFEPGVTSKERGSGFGLWLVRRVLTNHKGSIDLRDFRHGTVFELKLQRELSKHE